MGIVTTPFSFEGRLRRQQAVEAIEELRRAVDTLIIIPNDKLLEAVDPNLPVRIMICCTHFFVRALVPCIVMKIEYIYLKILLCTGY